MGEAGVKSALRELVARAALETDNFMRKPVRLRGMADAFASSTPQRPALAGMRVGPYRLLREIGSGGMGAVWLAERVDGVLRRQVALKLPRARWDAPASPSAWRASATSWRRSTIRTSRACTTPASPRGPAVPGDGVCRGQPHRRLLPRDAARRARRVCSCSCRSRARSRTPTRGWSCTATSSPRTSWSRRGQVRLLDFGIAKLIEATLAQRPRDQPHPAAGRALTPDYAHRSRSSGEPVTVAVDVYSLGVVLYELLAGQRPYRLETSTPARWSTRSSRVDARPASTRAPREVARAHCAATSTRSSHKALKKVPAERYATVDAFAADVRRHLDGAPVSHVPTASAIGFRVPCAKTSFRPPSRR